MSSITITDVARHAGVSIKTVSRVVNRDGTVKAANRDRVNQAIRTLGYVPNLAARALRSNKSHLLAFFFEVADSENLGAVQSGLLSACRSAAYHLVVERVVPDDPRRLENIAILLRQSQIDGAVLMPPLSDDPALLALLDAMDVKYVRIVPALDYAGAPAVWADDYAAAKAVTQHLIALGHEHLGFVRSGPNHPVSAPRHAGFVAALSEAGLANRPEWITQADFSIASGKAAGDRILALADRPTAIFASNDHLAIGVMRSAMERGIAVPDQLSVFGFDNSRSSQIVTPELSTVSQPISAIANCACELLFASLRGEAPGDRTLREFTIIPRQSCAPPPSSR